MKNNIKSLVFAVIVMSLIIVAPIAVNAQTNNGDDDAPVQSAAVADPNTSNGGDDVLSDNISGGTINGNDDTSSGVTTNGGDDVSLGAGTTNGGDDNFGGTTNGNDDTFGGTTNGGDDIGGTQPPGPIIPPVTPPITPPADNGGGNGSGPVGSTGGGSSSSSGSTVTFVAGTSPTLTSISQCEYIKNYLKLGGNNSTSEVNKLQVFLKNNEKLDVDVTGIFDEKTFKAVEAFQAKYLNETMLPWGVTTPTGQVYFTTKDKINEVYCKTNFTLTAEQIREIEAYRLAFINGTIESEDEVIVGTITSTTSIPLNGEGIEGETGETQTASVAGTSFFGRVWKFIKGIFGR